MTLPLPVLTEPGTVTVIGRVPLAPVPVWYGAVPPVTVPTPLPSTVTAVPAPTGLPYSSRTVAVKVCLPPGTRAAFAGEIAIAYAFVGW